MTGSDPDYSSCKIGPILDKIIERLGSDCLTGEIYELFRYIMEADTDTLENAVSGISVQDIIDHEDDFNTLMGVLNTVFDPGGRYEHVYEGLFDYDGDSGIIDKIRNATDSEIKISDLKQVLEDICSLDLSTGGDTEARLDQSITALIKIMEGKSSFIEQTDIESLIGLMYDAIHWLNNEAESSIDTSVIKSSLTELLDLFATDGDARQDLRDLLYSAGLLLTSLKEPDYHNAWDNDPTTDTERILYHTRDLLDPLVVDRGAFQSFIENALTGIAPIVNTATLAGMLEAIAANGPYPSGMGQALYRDMIQYNMYGQPRDGSDVNTSELRTLLFVMEQTNIEMRCSDSKNALVQLLGNTPVLSLVGPKHKINGVNTYNIALWTVGDVVETPSQGSIYETFDYILYSKDYDLLGGLGELLTGSIYGLTGFVNVSLLGGPALYDNIRTPFNSFVNLGGGGPFSYNSTTGYASYPGYSAGTEHKLLALALPLMEYFWDIGHPDYLVDLLASLNEIHIDSPNTLDGHFLDVFENDGAGDSLPGVTFGNVLKSIEGPDGYGLLTYALRPHADDDNGILDPLLDLLVKVIGKLDSADDPEGYSPDGYTGTKLLDALIYESLDLLANMLEVENVDDVDLSDPTQQAKLTDKLFAENTGWLDKISQFLAGDSEKEGYANHDILVTMTAHLGNILLKNADLDPLMGYITGSTTDNNFFNNINNIWASGTTWDNLKEDKDSITQCIKNITGKDSFDILGSIETVLNDLKDLDSLPSDIDDKPFTKLLSYLLIEDSNPSTYYNPFVDSLLAIIFKTLDVYDETYNLDGEIKEDATLAQALNNLTAYYDLKPIQNLLVALTETTVEESGNLLLWQLLQDVNTLITDILGDENISTEFLQAMFKEVSIGGESSSVISTALDLIKLSAVIEDNGVSMQAVMEDMINLLGSLDLEPGGDVFDAIYTALDFVIQNSSIN
ncbi:MAG: hypothetical protein J7L53_02550 [Deltaproteobacteria bacterium]|nr:hypothetical protein [Deltaproteobacteria bacterium]